MPGMAVEFGNFGLPARTGLPPPIPQCPIAPLQAALDSGLAVPEQR
jgi:hypothetical protein